MTIEKRASYFNNSKPFHGLFTGNHVMTENGSRQASVRARSILEQLSSPGAVRGMELAGPVPDVVTENETQDNSSQSATSCLEGFTQLGPQILYHNPEQLHTDSRRVKPNAPDLVILCSWLYAGTKNIAKYTIAYQRLYPTSPILLLKQDGSDVMWRPNSWSLENLKPAVAVVRDLDAERGGQQRILMHVFSNGGAFSACQLADAYARPTADTQTALLLPISALVIDSGPSLPSISSGYVAMSQGLPRSIPAPIRAIGGLLAYAPIATMAIMGKVIGGEDIITRIRRKLNDRKGPFMQQNVKRVYIYGENDELVPCSAIEAHAQEAKSVFDSLSDGLGEKLIQQETFQGSKHVAHMIVDAERYWNIVQKLFDLKSV